MNQHIAPTSLRSAPKDINLHCILTHRVFARTDASRFSWADDRKWSWIAARVADEFECEPDDVHAVETEHHLDAITVKGAVVAYLDLN